MDSKKEYCHCNGNTVCAQWVVNSAEGLATGLTANLGREVLQGRGSGWDLTRVVAEARSDLATVERLADERERLHDALKRLWNEDTIVQVHPSSAEAISI